MLVHVTQVSNVCVCHTWTLQYTATHSIHMSHTATMWHTDSVYYENRIENRSVLKVSSILLPEVPCHNVVEVGVSPLAEPTTIIQKGTSLYTQGSVAEATFFCHRKKWQMWRHSPLCCSVLQYIAVCGIVLQCVAQIEWRHNLRREPGKKFG